MSERKILCWVVSVAVCVLGFVLGLVVALSCVCAGFGVVYYVVMGDLMGSTGLLGFDELLEQL